jgi:uncharacterized protein (TIGR03437 family)
VSIFRTAFVFFFSCLSLAAAATCTPTKLIPVFVNPPAEFQTVPGFPVPIDVQLVDDCGNPVSGAIVVATFSNGDPPFALTEFGKGRYSATWQPRGKGSTKILADASDPVRNLHGQAVVSGSSSTFTSISFQIPDPQFLLAEAGGAPINRTITITSDPPGQRFEIHGILVGIESTEDSELTVEPSIATTPATVKVQLKPSISRGGNTIYQALFRYGPLSNATFLSLPFTVAIAPPQTPALAVSTEPQLFTYIGASKPQSRQISVGNRSGVPLHFSTAVSTSSGGQWLRVSITEADTTIRAPIQVTVTADPTGLAPGTYSGKVIIAEAGDGDTDEIPVTMTVTDDKPSILLSQIGLTFNAVEKGRSEPAQSISILNGGKGILNWTATPRTTSGGSWLTVQPGAGQSTAGAADNSRVSISADATGLAAGQYYGLIEVAAPDADNGPQYITVVLRVAPNDGRPVYFVAPSGLVFSATAGDTTGLTQIAKVYDLSGKDVAFTSASGISKIDDPDWLFYTPIQASSGMTGADGGVAVNVTAIPTGLSAGVHRGTITLQFPDGSTRVIDVLFQVAAQQMTQQQARRANPRDTPAACTPTRVDMQYTSAAGASVAAGWPATILVRAIDDCAQPLTSGSIDTSFSNGDAPLNLSHVQNGMWAGTWIPSHGRDPSVRLTFHAADPPRGLDSRSPFPAELPLAQQDSPVVDSIMNPVSWLAGIPLAPGSLISIFGSRFSAADHTSGAPYPATLGDTVVAIGGRAAPLEFVNGNQLNGVLPFSLPVNTTVQVVVTRGTTISTPVSVTIAAAQPTVFTVDGTGKGQAVAYHDGQPGVLADVSNPASPGETISIECVGLGAVLPSIDAGTISPDSSSTARTVTLQINGASASVLSAALKAGAVGIYQILAVVPSDAMSSGTATLQVSVNERVSEPVSIAIRQPGAASAHAR